MKVLQKHLATAFAKKTKFWLRCLQTLEMTKHNTSRKIPQRSTGFKCCTALMHVRQNIHTYDVEYGIFLFI